MWGETIGYQSFNFWNVFRRTMVCIQNNCPRSWQHQWKLMDYGKNTAPGTISQISFNLWYFFFFTTAQIRDDKIKWAHYIAMRRSNNKMHSYSCALMNFCFILAAAWRPKDKREMIYPYLMSQTESIGCNIPTYS